MNWREVTSLFHLLYVFSPCCVNHVPCSVISAAGSIVMSYQFCWWFRWWRTCLQWRRLEYNPWVRKIPWRRARQLTPVFLPGESHGQRSLMGYSPWGHKASDMSEALMWWWSQHHLTTFTLQYSHGFSPVLKENLGTNWEHCTLVCHWISFLNK